MLLRMLDGTNSTPLPSLWTLGRLLPYLLLASTFTPCPIRPLGLDWTGYTIGSHWLPNSEKMSVDVSTAMSDHFPLCLNIVDYALENMHLYGHTKPLMVNNSLLTHAAFKYQVNDLIQKWVLEDGKDVSKAFYKKLRCKKSRQNLVVLHQDDGPPLTKGCDILDKVTQYYNDLLNVQPQNSEDRQSAIHTLLDTVNPCIERITADRLEQPIQENEIWYALQKLPNEKCPGICGLSKEFMISFWHDLKKIVCPLFNAVWISQCMDPALKQRIIKLIPKSTFPKSLAEWRPITMMGILYKILAKTIAIRITPELRKCIHPAQTGFIAGRSILDNILTVQIGIEHALVTNQDMVMFQIDFLKAFDTVQWDFISSVLTKLGFGPRISGFIYLIGQNAYSRVIINGRLSEKYR
ncbi:hypothetical protein L7F22_033793 [Adiantum nelumboides]|nr:hypothetical protein [Adiantum nelumboides]